MINTGLLVRLLLLGTNRELRSFLARLFETSSCLSPLHPGQHVMAVVGGKYYVQYSLLQRLVGRHQAQ